MKSRNYFHLKKWLVLDCELINIWFIYPDLWCAYIMDAGLYDDGFEYFDVGWFPQEKTFIKLGKPIPILSWFGNRGARNASRRFWYVAVNA
jgi:hypothetical protein